MFHLSDADLMDIEIGSISYFSLQIREEDKIFFAFERCLKTYCNLKKGKINAGTFVFRFMKAMIPIYLFDRRHEGIYKKFFSPSACQTLPSDLRVTSSAMKLSAMNTLDIRSAVSPFHIALYTLAVSRAHFPSDKIYNVLEKLDLCDEFGDEDAWDFYIYEVEVNKKYAVITAEDRRKITLSSLS